MLWGVSCKGESALFLVANKHRTPEKILFAFQAELHESDDAWDSLL